MLNVLKLKYELGNWEIFDIKILFIIQIKLFHLKYIRILLAVLIGRLFGYSVSKGDKP
jgi:hypothetical protein